MEYLYVLFCSVRRQKAHLFLFNFHPADYLQDQPRFAPAHFYKMETMVGIIRKAESTGAQIHCKALSMSNKKMLM